MRRKPHSGLDENPAGMREPCRVEAWDFLDLFCLLFCIKTKKQVGFGAKPRGLMFRKMKNTYVELTLNRNKFSSC
jgi:hypothetical protein